VDNLNIIPLVSSFQTLGVFISNADNNR